MSLLVSASWTVHPAFCSHNFLDAKLDCLCAAPYVIDPEPIPLTPQPNSVTEGDLKAVVRACGGTTAHIVGILSVLRNPSTHVLPQQPSAPLHNRFVPPPSPLPFTLRRS